ncbi:hypothetical protein JCM19237_917 [Photobacterium aphoticum]|uniref:Uncharacterized protein n=1 Tax=Photobacterium aphoticum TaxID=754436 RepID=A0A090R0P0_9GAMM|nr:hypothetical protein JCM19237_917 [Photobacterium aphoticum]
MSSQIEWKTYDAVFAIVDNTASSYVIKNEADWSIRDTLVPGDALTISQPRFCLEASTMLSDRKHYCDQFRYPLDEPQTPDYSQPVQMASYYRLMQETPEYQPVIPEEMYRSLAEKFRLQQLYTGEHYSKRIRKRDEMLWYSAADIVAIAQHLQPYCEQVGNICDDVKEDLSRLWQEGTDKPCKNACWSAILTASDDVDFHILSNVSEVNSLNYIDRG